MSIFRVVLIFIGLLPLSAGSLYAREKVPVPAEDSEIHADPPGWFFSVVGGYAWKADGTVLYDSGAGLGLIQSGINRGILYSPGISEAVRQVGPLYTIPGFSLGSRSLKASLSQYSGLWEVGGSFGYVDIVGSAAVPTSFLDLSYFHVDVAGLNYLPVTSRRSHSVLATDFFGEAFLFGHLNVQDGWDLYGGPTLGAGRGWLAGFGGGPYLNEVHLSLSLGVGYRLGGVLYSLRATETDYLVKSAPTSLIDRRKVLVNPRRGNVDISRVEMSISLPLF